MFCYHLDTCMQFHLSGHVCGRAKSNKKYRCAFACAGFYALVIIFYHILFTTSNVFFFNWIVQIKMMVFVFMQNTIICRCPEHICGKTHFFTMFQSVQAEFEALKRQKKDVEVCRPNF